MVYSNDQNGWAEWSKYVLKELERLGDSYENISEHLINLPCKTHQEVINGFKDQLNKIISNDLRHVNNKLNALLFTVLGSVFVGIIFMVLRMFIK